MPPRRILVTGARGFVGSHLLPALRRAFPGAELLDTRFDVTDPDAVDAALSAAAPDALVHLAAVAAISEARADPEAAWRVNLHGTLTMARGLAARAPGCLMVFASSGDIYGASFRSGGALTEDAAAAPLNAYAATKAAADLALGAMAAEGLRVVRLRAFNHTGPGQTATYVVPAFAEQVVRIAAGRQEPVLRVGALDSRRDFLDVRDVCAAYVACIARGDALAPGTVLNIASGQPRRVGDVLQALLDAAGVAAEIEVDRSRLRAADIPVAMGDASRAREALGWRPSVLWEQTIRDVLAYWQERLGPGQRRA